MIAAVYKGSKAKFAQDILAHMPPAKHFYDLFGGGGNMTKAALESGKFEVVHYNELNPTTFAIVNSLNSPFLDLRKYYTMWVDSDHFKLKLDPLITYFWSFLQNCDDYAYAKGKQHIIRDTLVQFFAWQKATFGNVEPSRERRLRFAKENKDFMDQKRAEFGAKSPTDCLFKHLVAIDKFEFCKPGQQPIYTNLSWDQVQVEPDSVVYLDPPYVGTNTVYNKGWNQAAFHEKLKQVQWEQCFLSEYFRYDEAPFNYPLLWTKAVTGKSKGNREECLFKVEN